MARIKSSRTLFITIEGEPRVGNGVTKYCVRNPGVNERMYSKFIDLAVDTAVREQQWQMTDLPVYLFVRAWYKQPSEESLKRYSKPGLFCNTRTRIDSLIAVVLEAIVGKVVARATLIASINITKLYTDKEPRTEIFIGIPSDWEELENDLSYAEEACEELEKQ